jgi:hypothetical protein
MKLILIQLIAIFLIAPVAVRAEPELHVVGIYEGFDRSAGQIHGPKARVILSRPEAEVILVLSSYNAVRWEVELGRDTAPPSIVLSQRGKGGRQSEVWIDGAQLEDPTRMDLPLTYKSEGENFRALVQLVPDRFGIEQMTSFSGAYSASEFAFDISAAVDDPRYRPDYLQRELSPALVPESLRALVAPEALVTIPDVRLAGEGFVTRAADGVEEIIALPLEMPDISWPKGAVRDAATGTLYGVTLGGDGYLFAYDEAAKTWRVDRSMDGLDAHSLFLDAEGRRLIMPLGLGAPGRIAVVDLETDPTGPIRVLELDRPLPGYSDLYDPGNGPAPDLIPVGIEGDMLLLITRGDHRLGQRPVTDGSAVSWRAYLVDLSEMTVHLVGYGDASTLQ